MDVLIVEDEKPAANKLKQLLGKIDASITVVDTVETVEHTINWLQTNTSPDIILMDIQLDDGICFEIFDIIKVNIPIIFTTAYDEYVMKAFKVNGIDYLLKPIDLNALTVAINKYKSLFPLQKANNEKIKDVYRKFEKNYKTRFLVKLGLHYHSVLVNDIECFFIKGTYTYLITFSGKKYDVDYSLQQLEDIISPDLFFRINRNYIVNINSISNILSFSTNRLQLVLKNNSIQKEELLVSREKVTEFKKWLDK